jgi:hypothetical protein
MLFSKPISELTHEDIEAFCKRFREGLRVEYKSTFDTSVKGKLSRVVSSFANSYGGVLVVGVNTNGGIPVEPFDGIEFEDREPRLTVENICRSDIFPEAFVYQNLVPSRVLGKAFLVVQVDESPKAPHAIENNTRVYRRTGDSANPTTLADMTVIERLLARRRDVSARWDEFFADSNSLSAKVSMPMDAPLLEIRAGPQYPSDVVILREKVFQFLAGDLFRRSVGFYASDAFRHPTGALLARSDGRRRYLNVGELGMLHYLELLESTGYSGGAAGSPTADLIYPFWWVTPSILRILGAVRNFATASANRCQLRLEARLINVSKVPFTLSFENPFLTTPVFTLSTVAPAWTNCTSEMTDSQIIDTAVELLYQLRWLFGIQNPHTRCEIRPVVEREFPSAQIPYSTNF